MFDYLTLTGVRTLSEQVTLLQNERRFTVLEEGEEDTEPSHEELGEIMMNTGKIKHHLVLVTSEVLLSKFEQFPGSNTF